MTGILLTVACTRPALVRERAMRESTLPLARAHHAVAYDSQRGRFVVFGGSGVVAGAPTNFDDLREWDGARWGVAHATGLRRTGHRLVYDDGRERLLLIGGADSAVDASTYRWSDAGWIAVTSNPAMTMIESAVAYDSRRQRVVLYGGSVAGIPVATMWELDGDRWTRIEALAPGALANASMAYDERRGRIVLFGGRGPADSVSNRTWEWDGTAWKQREGAGPIALSGAAMAYDPVRGVVLLFGGTTARFSSVSDTWSWDGSRWTRLEAPGPGARGMAQMAFDRRRGEMLLFGGRIRYPVDTDELWAWNGEAWRLVGK